MAKNKKLTEYDYFEVMDRASVAEHYFNNTFNNHPLINQDKKLNNKFNKVCQVMNEFYQLAAEKCFNFKDKK